MLFFNILNFAGFSMGKYFLRKSYNPQFMSNYTIVLGCFLILYFLGNFYLFVYFLIKAKVLLSLISLIFFFLPIVYGVLSNYKTSNSYINIQILTFLINGLYIWTILKI